MTRGTSPGQKISVVGGGGFREKKRKEKGVKIKKNKQKTESGVGNQPVRPLSHLRKQGHGAPGWLSQHSIPLILGL